MNERRTHWTSRWHAWGAAIAVAVASTCIATMAADCAPAGGTAAAVSKVTPDERVTGTVIAVDARAGTFDLMTGVDTRFASGASICPPRRSRRPRAHQRSVHAGAGYDRARQATADRGRSVRGLCGRARCASARGEAMKAAGIMLVVLTAVNAVVGTTSCPRTPQIGDPLRGLSPEELARFAEGRDVFERTFTPETGLGPLFNADACGECHEEPVAGGGGDEVEVHVGRHGAGGFCDPLVDEGGPVIQQHATPALRAALGIDREPMPSGATESAARTAPAVFGLGLLDAVPDRAILALADPDDRNHDGVSGRPNRFVDGRLGRFGRKAFVPTLAEFNAGAFTIEQGITTPAVPSEESIGGKPIPPGVDPTPEPELSEHDMNVANDFVRFLAPPPALPLDAQGQLGRTIFGTIRCASCHVPSLVTGENPVRALRLKTVHAYSDLLLHDMGPGRADICFGLASPSEFRTQPLMGLRFASAFLHDGKAKTIEEAILLHDGEAAWSRKQFERLSPKRRAAVLEFLGSL
jgi:hypothetical protein